MISLEAVHLNFNGDFFGMCFKEDKIIAIRIVALHSSATLAQIGATKVTKVQHVDTLLLPNPLIMHLFNYNVINLPCWKRNYDVGKNDYEFRKKRFNEITNNKCFQLMSCIVRSLIYWSISRFSPILSSTTF